MDDKVKQSKEDANHIPSTEKALSRREALERLAKLGVYSAPTVTTLMSAQLSHAASSIPAGNTNCNNGGEHNLPGADSPSATDVADNPAHDGFQDINRRFFGFPFGDIHITNFLGDGTFMSFMNDTSADC